MWIARDGRQCAVQSGHFLREGRGANQKFIKYKKDFLSILDYVIKKGGHRYGKKPGDREYKIANQLKKCKQKLFQGNHDLIHTRWTIPQKNDWKWSRRRCLSPNGCSCVRKIIPTIWHHKKISITRVIGGWLQTRQVPILCQWRTELTSIKDCLLCSNWNKKELAEINNGHRVLLLHGGVGKVLGGLLNLVKVTMEMDQVLIEQGDLLYKYLEQFFKAWFSWIHLLCYRWIVYSWRRSTVTDGWCKYNISNDPFSRCKCATIWLQMKLTMTEYNLTTSAQVDCEIQKELYLVGTGNKLHVEIGTNSGKLRIGHECVVTKHDADANDNIFDCVALHDASTNDHFFDTHMSVARKVSLSSNPQYHIIRTQTVAKVLSLPHHPRVHGYLSVSLHFDSRFYFLDFLTSLIFLLQFLKSVVNLHNFCNESMDSTDEFSFSQNKRPLPCPVLVATSFMCHSLHFKPHC